MLYYVYIHYIRRPVRQLCFISELTNPILTMKINCSNVVLKRNSNFIRTAFYRDSDIKQPLGQSVAVWFYSSFECYADIKKQHFSHQAQSSLNCLSFGCSLNVYGVFQVLDVIFVPINTHSLC